MRIRLDRLAVLVLPTAAFLATAMAPAWAAELRVKIVTVYADDPNDPFANPVSLIKVVVGGSSGITGDNDDVTKKCVGGTNFRRDCTTGAQCPGGGTCEPVGDNDFDGEDDGFGIARIKVAPGFQTVKIPTAELVDFDGKKYRVGSVRIEETVTANGQLCRPTTKPEGEIGFLFRENVDHSSQSDYTVAIRIVPLSAPDVTNAVTCGGGEKAAKAIVKCKRAVVKAGTDYFEARLKALAKCEDKKHQGKLAANLDCRSETKTREVLLKATAAIGKAIGKACGGGDKKCGGDITGDLSEIVGFGAQCPGFRGACKNAIADCTGIVDCVACANAAAADDTLRFMANVGFGDPENQKQLVKCQRAVVDAGIDLAVVTANLKERCWNDQIETPAPGASCLGGFAPFQGDLLRARNKAKTAVCKACGGKEEKGCGGPDDFTPAMLGAPSTCFAGAIMNLEDLVSCQAYIAERQNRCRDGVGVPSLELPINECNEPLH